MASILWFLIIGVLFFFLMKYGCGAHMGGHGGHGGGHEGHGDMKGPAGPEGQGSHLRDGDR